MDCFYLLNDDSEVRETSEVEFKLVTKKPRMILLIRKYNPNPSVEKE